MTFASAPRFADLTTMGVGGPSDDYREVHSTPDLIATAQEVWASGEQWLVCGGGSNLLVSDEGFDGVVIAPRSQGIRVVDELGPQVIVQVDAGVEWDALVEHAVATGWGGIEALSGIPGRVGAAPIQNIGAYGSEFASVAVGVEFLDEGSEKAATVAAVECAFGYRTSAFKEGRVGIVTSVTLALDVGGYSAPIAYAQLSDKLGVPLGSRIEAGRVREAVLALRRSKGMVFDPSDPDTHGCGSFFVNPVVSADMLALLPSGTPYWRQPVEENQSTVIPLDALATVDVPQRVETAPSSVKLSAAWLIEHAGIGRGFSLPGSGAAVSPKHTLAITNRGSATAADVVELAGYIQTRVASEFGVVLQPEPRLVGLSL